MTSRYLVPSGLTMGQFVYVIQKRIRPSAQKVIFIFVDRVLPPASFRSTWKFCSLWLMLNAYLSAFISYGSTKLTITLILQVRLYQPSMMKRRMKMGFCMLHTMEKTILVAAELIQRPCFHVNVFLPWNGINNCGVMSDMWPYSPFTCIVPLHIASQETNVKSIEQFEIKSSVLYKYIFLHISFPICNMVCSVRQV